VSGHPPYRHLSSGRSKWLLICYSYL
jgi:hypothetical protein